MKLADMNRSFPRMKKNIVGKKIVLFVCSFVLLLAAFFAGKKLSLSSKKKKKNSEKEICNFVLVLLRTKITERPWLAHNTYILKIRQDLEKEKN